MHFKESKQMVYGMICGREKERGKWLNFIIKLKIILKKCNSCVWWVGACVGNLVGHQAPRIHLC